MSILDDPRDEELRKLRAKVEAADRLANAGEITRRAILRLQDKWSDKSGWNEVSAFAATYAEDDEASLTAALTAYKEAGE